MTPSRSRGLGLALGANALFSAACGLALVLQGPEIATAMGGLPGSLATALGVGLAVFAAFVAATAMRVRIGAALVVSALDLAWVAASVPLVLVPDLLSPAGVGAVTAVAATVAALAAAQLAGMRAMLRDEAGGPGRYRHCVRVRTRAPAAAMWSVVADLGGIARHSPALASSRLRGGGSPGVGAVRDCANHRGETWSEEVETFDPAERTITLRFRTEAPGFPFPVSVMSGGWRVVENGDGTAVDVWWSLTPTRRPGWLLVALMTVPLDRDMRVLVARMAADATGRPAAEAPRRPALAYC